MRHDRLRSALVTLHVWLGLTIGALWALQGLTGALLVFHREVDRMAGVAGTGGPPASADRIMASVLQGQPSAEVTRLAMTDSHRDVVAVHYIDHDKVARAVLVDAASARVVGQRDLEPWTPFGASASRWIDRTHYALSAGPFGETLIGASGLVLMTAAATGLWIGWPRGRKLAAWKSVFAVSRWRKTEHRLYGWHRALGLLAAAVLIVLGFTGAQMNFGEAFRNAFSAVMPMQPRYDPMAAMHTLGQAPAGAPHEMALGDYPVTPQQAIDTAQQRFPHAVWVRVFMPTPMASVYSVRLYQPGELRAWLGATAVSVDAHTGAVLDVYDALQAPLANRWLDASFPIHNGEFAGLAGRLLVMFAGLALPTLYVTGLWAWLRKRRLRVQRALDKGRQGSGIAYR